MAIINLIKKDKISKLFTWNDLQTFFIRSQYSELLNIVIEKDNELIADFSNSKNQTIEKGNSNPKERESVANYYNHYYCLALNKCNDSKAKTSYGDIGKKLFKLVTPFAGKTDTDFQTLLAQLDIKNPCEDEIKKYIKPKFYYEREGKANPINTYEPNGNIKDDINVNDLVFDNQLPLASILWLYYYERMGIFKILGVLMDDYNYKGKFPISGKSSSPSPTPPLTEQYSELMDTICTLYRLGIGSNLRDRIGLYQRVLGVSIENNLNVETEKNEGFMRNFNKFISLSVDFYRDKQLSEAIKGANTTAYRSSVATQTAIRDTILMMQKNFEVYEYGRNRINTYLGISMVYATICLLRMVKFEIGVPRQYNEPHEFIPAAYDILVTKKAVTSNEINRFTIYDNCATNGFRILADLETIDSTQLTTIGISSPLEAWMTNIEGWVEGYRNAFNSISEPASAIV